MNLYRILLVDDEEEVRQSIIKKIDWLRVGFQVVGDAGNGADALEKIEAVEPDVVLTDIKMPYMDGLTLTRRIRQNYPSMKVLIFSGFDDFEYAKMAIKLNVTEYILKPVNVEELTAILCRVKENLDEEIAQKRNISRLRENYRNSLPILRDHFLNDLVRNTIPAEQIEGKLREYHIPISGALSWIAGAIDVASDGGSGEGMLSFHEERELIPISVRQLVEEKLKNFCRFAVFQSSPELVLIAALDEDNTQAGLSARFSDLCKEARKVLGLSITIGIGESVTAVNEISRSFYSAVNALGYQAIVGRGGTIYINDVEPVSRGKLQFDGKEEAELIAGIKFGPRETIEAAVQKIAERMDDAKVHIRQHQVYMLSIVNSVTQLMQQYDIDPSRMLGSDSNYFKVLQDLQKREDFATWLFDTSCQIHETMNRERDNATRNVIEDAKQYIMDHYPDPNLSVEMLCKHLHMSPAYFSTMFKKETGQAYIAYLTEVRLNKALELLNKTEEKTYVIAAKVGYPEQNYFSYVFKKRFGVSPTKYRGLQRG